MATKAEEKAEIEKRRIKLRKIAGVHYHTGRPELQTCDMPPEAEAVTHYAELEQRDEALETLSLESDTL